PTSAVNGETVPSKPMQWTCYAFAEPAPTPSRRARQRTRSGAESTVSPVNSERMSENAIINPMKTTSSTTATTSTPSAITSASAHQKGKRPEMPWGGSPSPKAPAEKEKADQEGPL